MSFVLESSVALSWCLPDEEEPAALKVLELARTSVIFVPPLWHVEMANILGLGLRKQRLSSSHLVSVLTMLSNFELRTDADPVHFSIDVLLALMEAHSLTAYDATYLHLALRLGLPLATLDVDLAQAAKQAGISLLCQAE